MVSSPEHAQGAVLVMHAISVRGLQLWLGNGLSPCAAVYTLQDKMRSKLLMAFIVTSVYGMNSWLPFAKLASCHGCQSLVIQAFHLQRICLLLDLQTSVHTSSSCCRPLSLPVNNTYDSTIHMTQQYMRPNRTCDLTGHVTLKCLPYICMSHAPHLPSAPSCTL